MNSYNHIAAANIRNARLSKQYSQEYMALKLKISQNAYSKLELGRTPITVDRLFYIAQIFDMKGTDFLNQQNFHQQVAPHFNVRQA